MKGRNQKGFTLLEVLITLTLVSILLAIAVPQYLQYIARGQVAEGISLGQGLVDEIQDRYAFTGALPTAIGDIKPGTVAADHSGRYVVSTDLNGGAIIVTYGNNASTAIATETVVLSAYQNGAGDVFYFCDGATGLPVGLTKISTTTVLTTVADEYLPQDCR